MADDGSSNETVGPDKWVYIEMPSGNSKLAFLKTDSVIKLGKFGSFRASDVIGKPYGLPYEIVENDRACFAGRGSLFDDFEVDEDPDASNKEIFATRDAQKLSNAEIQQMKNETLEGKISSETLIQRVAENNATFERKTQFSKAKYLKRKEQKFGKIFRLFDPTPSLLCQYYLDMNPSKTKDLRPDSLSQMLSFGNVRSGANVAVVDEIGGLLIGAVMERLGSRGTVCAIYDGDTESYECLPYLNWKQKDRDRLHTLPWNRILTNLTDPHASSHKIERVKRRNERYQAYQSARRILEEGGFDCLITASQYSPSSIIQSLSHLIRGSGNLVVYSGYKEPLPPAYSDLRSDTNFVNVQLTETFTREYQAKPGRFHPLMNTNGNSGWLLTAIRVVSKPRPMNGSSSNVVEGADHEQTHRKRQRTDS
ncbi:Gcd10p-domain-containing protein [Gonapodya prolifera JEL478]|uniref:tRNA (adenine(58)-N(1))-methyltransferase non-catalytic subunit TRM6 n=1 Tax=Gonapodya prolifera (strain JEL478) TaxID=1344416 RepID=A0A139AFB3_GONPJ|nr:Gcd10p-domain-containing protein [Gonapodya prolifera JEL478]|eukprot:KXS15103.1 Gcd10p-domain-containing protein [Gonapodya prolifera JEL478]